MTADLSEGAWPASIAKPPLPAGYEWVCLRQALGLRNDADEHPWWIRLRWTIKNGKKRILRLPIRYFPTAQEAIDYAAAEAKQHAERKAA